MSIQVRPGEIITQCASGLQEGGEGPIDEADGATITFRWIGMDDVQSGASVPGVYVSDGTYCVDITAPTNFGRYRLEVATTLDGVTTYSYRDVTVGVAYKGGTTLADLRRGVARKLRDLVLLTATETSAGLSTFIDADNLWQEPYALVSSQIVVTDGHPDNVSAVRRVTGNNGAGVLSLSRDLLQPIALGDKADLVNISGKGFPVDAYTQAIKETIRYAGREVDIPLEFDLADAFDDSDSLITLPYGMTKVYALEYVDGTDTFGLGMGRTRSADTDGWFSLGSGRIRLEGRGRYAAHGYTVRVYGYGPHPDVYADDDIVAIDPEWVTLATASRLASLRTFDREWSQWAALWNQEANGRRLAMATSYMPNTVEVR